MRLIRVAQAIQMDRAIGKVEVNRRRRSPSARASEGGSQDPVKVEGSQLKTQPTNAVGLGFIVKASLVSLTGVVLYNVKYKI